MGKKTVLVVEDEVALQNAIRFKLESKGFEVLQAASKNDALRIIDSKASIDAFWLDHIIWQGDATEVLAKIKATDKYKNAPVMIVSNSSSDSTMKRYLDQGVDGFYRKAPKALTQVVDDLTTKLNP